MRSEIKKHVINYIKSNRIKISIFTSIFLGVFLSFLEQNARLVITYVLTAGLIGALGAIVKMNIEKDYRFMWHCRDLITLAVLGAACFILFDDPQVISGFMFGILVFDVADLLKKTRILLHSIESGDKIHTDRQNDYCVMMMALLMLPVRAHRGLSGVTENARCKIHQGGEAAFNAYKMSSDIIGGFSRILVFGGISLFLMRESYDMWVSFGSIVGSITIALALVIFLGFIFYMRLALAYALVSLQEVMPPNEEFFDGTKVTDLATVEKAIIFLVAIVFGTVSTMLALIDIAGGL